MNALRDFSVVILVTQMEHAGAQRVALAQAYHLHERGYEVTLCFFYDKGGLLTDIQRQAPFRVVDLEAKSADQPRIINLLSTVCAVGRLYRLLRRDCIDVVMTFTHYSNVVGILVAWLAGVPVRISSQRNTLLGFPRWFLRADAWLVNSPLVDMMTAVSEMTRSFCIKVEGMAPHKVVTIPNGIDLAGFERQRLPTQAARASLRGTLDIPEQSRVLITVARLHPQKGHTYLVRAAPYILTVCPDVVFVLAGDGESQKEIEDLINQLGLSRHFRLFGTRGDIPQLLAISDLFVLPSLYEGMPNAVLEAMASQLAVIATRADGNQEIVVHAQTGLLVPKGDPTALAQAVIALLTNEPVRQAMGLAGYTRVRTKFSQEIMLRRHEALIQALLARKQIQCQKHSSSQDCDLASVDVLGYKVHSLRTDVLHRFIDETITAQDRAMIPCINVYGANLGFQHLWLRQFFNPQICSFVTGPALCSALGSWVIRFRNGSRTPIGFGSLPNMRSRMVTRSFSWVLGLALQSKQPPNCRHASQIYR